MSRIGSRTVCTSKVVYLKIIEYNESFITHYPNVLNECIVKSTRLFYMETRIRKSTTKGTNKQPYMVSPTELRLRSIWKEMTMLHLLETHYGHDNLINDNNYN